MNLCSELRTVSTLKNFDEKKNIRFRYFKLRRDFFDTEHERKEYSKANFTLQIESYCLETE